MWEILTNEELVNTSTVVEMNSRPSGETQIFSKKAKTPLQCGKTKEEKTIK